LNLNISTPVMPLSFWIITIQIKKIYKCTHPIATSINTIY
jgi:hypothetical protein